MSHYRNNGNHDSDNPHIIVTVLFQHFSNDYIHLLTFGLSSYNDDVSCIDILDINEPHLATGPSFVMEESSLDAEYLKISSKQID